MAHRHADEDHPQRAGVSPGAPALEQCRPASLAIAYRMLGSVSEAEDIVQETLLRVHRAIEDGERIDSLPAYVATVTTRLSINELRSARARRERYVGEWLPEPIATDAIDDPVAHAELADSLSLAMLVLLESLSPEQRAALLLHDVFDYGYAEIGRIIGKSEDNVRQLASRARRHVQADRPRFRPSREEREALTRRFLAAVQEGDLAGLETLLAHDVELTGDGGGKVPAITRRLHGRTRVARVLMRWMQIGARAPGLTLRATEMNSGPAVIVLDGQQRVLGVWLLEIAGGEVRRLGSIVNPDKLGHLGPVGDFGAMVRRSPPPLAASDPARDPELDHPPTGGRP